MENADPKTKTGNIVQQKVLKYELLILTIIIVAVCLAVLKVPYSHLLLTLVLLSAGTVYFLSAFALEEGSELTAIDHFLHKLVSMGSAVSITGILFIIQKWPSSGTLTNVGLMTLGICLIAMVYQRIVKPEEEKFNKLVFIRIIVLLAISGALLYFRNNQA
jgi:high-affinity nickel permease